MSFPRKIAAIRTRNGFTRGRITIFPRGEDASAENAPSPHPFPQGFPQGQKPRNVYISSPIPPPDADFLSSGISATAASVVRSTAAADAEFSTQLLVTFTGSMMPASYISTIYESSPSTDASKPH